MQLIYIHGFNSGPASQKGQMLRDYCQIHHPQVQVHHPDLNRPPCEVVEQLSDLISKSKQTGLVGSSLGGYFATLMVARHNVPAVLINPSTRPFDTLSNYVSDELAQTDLPPEHIVHTTEGGWNITRQDFQDLEDMYQVTPKHANKLLVLLKTGDDVINYQLAKNYFSQPEKNSQSQIIIDYGGDHAMLDFKEKIPLVMQFLFSI